jgi:hypothetical protein
MINHQHLERLFLAKRFPALLDAVVANGLALPLPLKVRLSRSPVAAVALGLRRLLELHHLLPSVGRDMTRWLLDRQQPTGRFTDAALVNPADISTECSGEDPLPTAIALAALIRLQRNEEDSLFPFAPRNTPAPAPGPACVAADPEVALAIDRGLAALAAFQNEQGLFAGADDRTWQEQAQTSALILMLLGGDSDFRASCRFADLADFFEDRAGDLDADTAALWHIARLDTPAPAPAPGSPAPGTPGTARSRGISPSTGPAPIRSAADRPARRSRPRHEHSRRTTRPSGQVPLAA